VALAMPFYINTNIPVLVRKKHPYHDPKKLPKNNRDGDISGEYVLDTYQSLGSREKGSQRPGISCIYKLERDENLHLNRMTRPKRNTKTCKQYLLVTKLEAPPE
jgi:hypothetical protein